jgi:hypothetical protein
MQGYDYIINAILAAIMPLLSLPPQAGMVPSGLLSRPKHWVSLCAIIRWILELE